MSQPFNYPPPPPPPQDPGGRGGPDIRSLDATLDAALRDHQERKSEGAAKEAQQAPRPSPTELFRQRFTQKLAPVAEELGKRLAARQIDLRVDASDLLHGGSGLLIEAHFDGHGSRLEGTVLSDVIAFQESRFRYDGGDSTCRMSAGPMLRTSTVTAQVFAKFLYEWVIKLVRSVSRT